MRCIVFGARLRTCCDLCAALISIFVSLFVLLALELTNQIGSVGQWCWISGPWWVQFVRECRSPWPCTGAFFSSPFTQSAFYSFLILSVLSCLICFVGIAYKMFGVSRRADLSAQQRAELGNAYLRFAVYPLLYGFVNSFRIVNRFTTWTGSSSETLGALHCFFWPLQGFINMSAHHSCLGPRGRGSPREGKRVTLISARLTMHTSARRIVDCSFRRQTPLRKRWLL